ncbi:MAG: hypothetical protein RLZZ436_3131, partial [Planctomycetota bacterium]
MTAVTGSSQDPNPFSTPPVNPLLHSPE